MRAANVGVLVGGLAVGALVGNRVVAGSGHGSSSKGWMIGGGALGAAVGTGVAWKAYNTAGSATSSALKGLNLLGVGALGLGVGAAIAGAFTSRREPIKPLPTEPTDPVESPEPAEPSEEPVPAEPDPDVPTPSDPTATWADASATMRALGEDAWIAQHLDPAERTVLAAGAANVGADPALTARVLQDLSSDAWVGPNYSPLDRVGLAIAGLEAGRTGAEVATTQVNVDGSLDTAGIPATADLVSPTDRSMLAQAAIRGAVDGETAAFLYAGIRNHAPLELDPHQAARLAAAALEGGASLDDATGAFDQVRTHPATNGLPGADQVTLAGGALRSGTTGTRAAEDFAVISGDEWIGELLRSRDLTTDQAARLSAAATGRQLTGEDAALTFVNAAADDAVWDAAEDYEQVVELSIGALDGGHTGAEAAAAFRAVSARGASTASLPVGTRFDLAAAALAGDGAPNVIAAYGRASTDEAFTAATTPAHDALLATGTGFDATSDSEVLEWPAPLPALPT